MEWESRGEYFDGDKENRGEIFLVVYCVFSIVVVSVIYVMFLGLLKEFIELLLFFFFID